MPRCQLDAERTVSVLVLGHRCVLVISSRGTRWSAVGGVRRLLRASPAVPRETWARVMRCETVGSSPCSAAWRSAASRARSRAGESDGRSGPGSDGASDGRTAGAALYGLGRQQVQQVRDDRRRHGRPRADAEPQRRGRPFDAVREEARLREPGQPGREDHDRPGVAARGAVEPGRRGVGDERQAVGDQRVEPRDTGRDTGGDGDLVEPVRGGDRRADGDGEAGQPDRRAERAGHRAPPGVRSGRRARAPPRHAGRPTTPRPTAGARRRAPRARPTGGGSSRRGSGGSRTSTSRRSAGRGARRRAAAGRASPPPARPTPAVPGTRPTTRA